VVVVIVWHFFASGAVAVFPLLWSEISKGREALESQLEDRGLDVMRLEAAGTCGDCQNSIQPSSFKVETSLPWAAQGLAYSTTVE
jgi:hypothetical protein